MKKLLLSLLIITTYSFSQEAVDSDEVILEKIRAEANIAIQKECARYRKAYEEADDNTKLYLGKSNASFCPIDKDNNQTLHTIIIDLATQMNLSLKKIALVFDDGFGFEKSNAGAIFRHIFYVGIDLIQKLDLNELKSILAHELAHLKLTHVQKRMKYASKISLLPFGALILTHILGRNKQLYQNHKYKILTGVMCSGIALFTLAYMKLSRKFEYEADSEAAKYVNKEHLKRALTKIDDNPEGSGWLNIFSTHPSLNQRLKNIDAQT